MKTLFPLLLGSIIVAFFATLFGYWYRLNSSTGEITSHIVVAIPREKDRVSSPLKVSGIARGGWFFEATAPLILTDWDGRIIAESYIEAQGEWMTDDFIPFSGTIDFTVPTYGERGTLIFQKANASGLSEHDDAFEVQILFTTEEQWQ